MPGWAWKPQNRVVFYNAAQRHGATAKCFSPAGRASASALPGLLKRASPALFRPGDLKFGGLGMLVFSGSMYRVGHGAFVAEIMGQFGQWEPPKKCA